MHSATQIIAQRAPPATRTKARWQPYYSIPSASSSSSSLPPRSPYINTPNASVSSPLAPHPSSCDLNRSRPSLSATTTQTPKESSQRDSTTKHKFAVGLIDQAVNTLSEIWRPQDIPPVFQPPPKATPPFTTTQSNVLSPPKQQNIISRISPHPPSSVSSPTQPSRPSAILKQSEIDQQKVNTQALLASGTDPDQNLLPIKTFVHEVLRRSRTSGSILQAALCYLEAIRPKVSEILCDEKLGIRAHYLPDSTILPATPEELEREAELCAIEDTSNSQNFDDSMKTVRVTDCGDPEDFDAMHQLDDGASISSLVAEPSGTSALPSTPSIPLPSPLLCPRRAFLASLILASKFFQDKCYSNRAWAKLSGLPPREIGRCERALGQALEWRLWVGKNPVAPQPTVTAAPPIRTIIRSQSESSILSPSTSNRPFFSQDGISNHNHQEFIQEKTTPSIRSGLRRCSTVPDHVFVARATSSCEKTMFTSCASDQGQDQDQDMDNIDENGKQELPSAISSDSEQSASSPSPETPGLTYSPSSTECSFGGDRTIQMSTFEDNMLPSVTGSKLWIDIVDPRCGAIRTASSVPQIKGDYEYDNNAFIFDLARVHAKTNVVSVVQSETGSCGAHYLWREDSRYIPLEAAGVH